MKVIRRVEFDRATMLVSSDAVEAYAAWSGATTYALGDRVRYTDFNVYESLQAGNLNKIPTNAPLWWVLVGPDNTQAMFDTQIETETTATGSVTVVVAPGAVDSVYVAANANSITLTVRDGLAGPIVFEETRSLTGEYVYDWYQYFFWDPTFRRTQEVFLDIPPFADAHLTLTVDSGLGSVEVGVFTFGRLLSIGDTGLGATAGIIDYSRKETDEFGQTLFVQRGYSKRLSAQVMVQNTQLNRVQRTLYDLRAVPSVWIGSTDASLSEPLVLFGFYRDFNTEIAYPRQSLCSLELEGLK